jgi:ribonuclease HI
MPNWKSNGWRRRKEKGRGRGEKRRTVARLDEQLQIHRVKYTHVAGHSGHPENDRCDELAVAAYQQYRR